MEVHAKYLDKYKVSKTLPGVASLIAASLVAAPANEALNVVNELQSVLASGQIATFSDSDEIPKAYLQFLYFDNDYKFKKSGFRQVSKEGEGSFETLTLEHVAEEDGFMMMFVANETNDDLNVFFDDLTVVHSEGPVIRKDDYYPFGLSYNTSTLGGALSNKYLYQGKELLDDLNLNIYDFHARGYDPVIGRTWQIDPMADSYYPWSPYAWTMNNPIKYMDPTGMFSTHTDEDGNVVAVYDDGDLGVYRHEGSVTKKDIDSRHSKDNTTAGGEKMGETEYWDEFRAHDNKTGETLESIQRGAKILFNETWDYIIDVKNRTSDQTGLSLTAFGSLPNQEFDIKTNSYFAPHGPATGKLLKGKYATARSAGNYLAGLNGATGKFSGKHISLKTYMRLAGTLHSGINNQGAPYYGEIPYAGRMIEAGFQSGINKRK